MTSRRTTRWSRAAVLAAIALATPMLASAEAEDTPPSVEELKQDTRALAEKLKNYTAEQRDEAARSISDTLEVLDERIATLEKRVAEDWDEMSDATREQTRESLDALRAQREKVGDWYERLKDSSSTAWGRMKKGFSSAYEGLSEAWDNAEREVEADENEKRRNSI
ncbi:hypothetical protein [Marinobacter sp. BGYM27]|uniref:hypothetical protein n=1 Tax=Marinobacter sp. BGYM27 TaxID=2975597 RepID=UPI0021A8AB89|nr:hypothetical protein [Marinobacter sp. BGYM27]MDG5499535.1 hypothetical protein [Marinobacter sp. BGYM27]